MACLCKRPPRQFFSPSISSAHGRLLERIRYVILHPKCSAKLLGRSACKVTKCSLHTAPCGLVNTATPNRNIRNQRHSSLYIYA